jgi:3-phenylpropionate/trans-cinnamate dioxygenase ferredoxin reductase subunit
VIDEFCRTSDANVLAAGDATNHFNHLLGRRLRLECWQAAQDQASTAAATIMGDELGYRAVPWMWSDQYETNLQVAGMPDPSAPFVSRGDPQSSSYSLFQLDDGVITAAITVNRAVDMPAARKLIARARSTDIHALSDVTVRLKTLLE